MKFLLLSTLFLTFFTPSNSQLIDITVCTDNNCNTNCISWTATNGQCATCRNDVCSISNPSSMIQNMNSITFYTDKKCSNTNIIPGTSANPITLDNTCHLLHANDMTVIGSYHASNTSALIGGIVGGILILIIIIICVSCVCCCKKRQIEAQQQQQQSAIIIDEKQIQQVYPRPLSGYGYEYNPQPYPQPQPYSQSQPYPQQTQQTQQNIYEPYIVAPVAIPQPSAQFYQTYPQQQYTHSVYYPPPPPPLPSAPPEPAASAPLATQYTQKYI